MISRSLDLPKRLPTPTQIKEKTIKKSTEKEVLEKITAIAMINITTRTESKEFLSSTCLSYSSK